MVCFARNAASTHQTELQVCPKVKKNKEKFNEYIYSDWLLLTFVFL